MLQYVRGYAPSGGEFEPFINERADGTATLQWLKENNICRGDIFSWGGSYFGLTQWAIGDLYSGAKAIQISSPRLEEVFYPGGAFALSTAIYWAGRNENIMARPAQIKRAIKKGGVEGAAEQLTGQKIAYYRDWLQKGDSKKYWQEHFPSAGKNMKGPVLLMAGWFDPFLPAMLHDWDELRKSEQEVKLVIGPWGHAQAVDMPDGFSPKNYRLESFERPLAWFKCVREKCSTAKVEIFLMGENRWLEMDDFPLAGEGFSIWQIDWEVKQLILRGGRVVEQYEEKAGFSANTREGQGRVELILDPANPTPSAGGVELGFDFGPLEQTEIQKRREVYVASSASLNHPLTLLGKPLLEGEVRDAVCRPDLAASLLDIYPDGTAYIITEGVKRFLPGNTSFRLDFWPTAYVIKQGHRLGLQLAPAKFPKYDLPRCAAEKKQEKIALRLSVLNDWSLKLPQTLVVDKAATNKNS